jgi:hypothetical protein
MQFDVEKVDTSQKYLSVTVRVRGSLVPHRHTVRVPWRLLNERYQDVIEGLEHEALAELKRTHPPAQLPLEAWE